MSLRAAGSGVFGVMTSMMRKRGSHTPAGNFSSKWGNKNFYKGKGGKKYGRVDQHGSWNPSEGRAPPRWWLPDMEGFNLRPYVAYEQGLETKLHAKRMWRRHGVSVEEELASR